jgi:hypothetical protein
MKRLSLALFAVVSAAAMAGEPSYSVADRFLGPDGSYDYISFDGANQRVFVGRETGVMAIDLPSRKLTGDFIKGEDVAAVLIIPDSSLMLATVGGADTARLFDRIRGTVKANIKTGREPDGALWIFRLTAAGKAVPVQSLQTHPYARTAALDPETGRLYLPAVQRRADASGEMKRVPGTFQVLVVTSPSH